MRKLISSGSTFEKDMGYSRAVVLDNWMFVSGTTGFDYGAMTISENVVEQCEQIFRNIKSAMEEGGFTLADIVRVHYMLMDARDFEPCWPIMQKYMGDIRPAATMFVTSFADPRMKIEIEVTAMKEK
jgi:enamine deaminase RidA (YjgF/YER057c/UK114 family)